MKPARQGAGPVIAMRQTMRVLTLVFAMSAGSSPVFAEQAGFSGASQSITEPEQLFRPRAAMLDRNSLAVHILIEPGNYLYRDRLKIEVNGKSIPSSRLRLPPAIWKQDPSFGRVRTYRNEVRIHIPWRAPKLATTNDALSISPPPELTVVSQGCADAGVCYPPIRHRFVLAAPMGSFVDPQGGGHVSPFSRTPQSNPSRLVLPPGNQR